MSLHMLPCIRFNMRCTIIVPCLLLKDFGSWGLLVDMTLILYQIIVQEVHGSFGTPSCAQDDCHMLLYLFFSYYIHFIGPLVLETRLQVSDFLFPPTHPTTRETVWGSSLSAQDCP